MNSVFDCALSPPTDNPGRPTVLCWDGRVDNPRDLQAILGIGTGAPEAPELVLAAYERWGLEGLRRVIGDWSVVIHDPRRAAIVLASDFAGVRPLYYSLSRPGRICWSLHLPQLVEHLGARALDEDYIAAFLVRGGHPSRTPYAGIAAVPPGHAVSATLSGTKVEAFWALPVGDVIRYADERRYDEQLRALLSEAVAVRLNTSEPVLAELSGGLDSSSVVCMATRLIQRGEARAPRLASVSYIHPGSLDAPFIEDVQRFCAIDGVSISTSRTPLVTADDVGGGWPQVWAPLHRAAATVASRFGASTFLTGQNGDLAMGNWLDDSLQVAGALRSCRFWGAACESLAWSRVLNVPMAWIVARAIRAALPVGRRREATYGLRVLAPSSTDCAPLSRELSRRVSERAGDIAWASHWQSAPPERRHHFLALSLLRELRMLQRPEVLRHLDYTHPFGHRPLVEFMLALPGDVLCRPGEPRRLMRRALAELWPDRLRARRSKSLFGRPWIEALRPLAIGLLQAPQWHVTARGWVHRASLTERLRRLVHGLDCDAAQLRQVILLEYWLRSQPSLV